MPYSNNSENKLELYIVSCHADKNVIDEADSSNYEVPIQAGAALTNIRTQDINDLDGLEDSISDRNERYSEGTAMYWIYRKSTAEYIGISHYRRRFGVPDIELEKLIKDDVDIITLESVDLGQSITDNYIEILYRADWVLFMDILLKLSPDYYEFARNYFNATSFHPCNMNIFRREIYKEFGDWAFPILDEFYHRSPRKTDRYQRRDAGFILERLSSLFVEKKRLEGYKIVEVPLIVLESKSNSVDNKCGIDDDLYDLCARLYLEDKITEIKYIVKEEINTTSKKSLRMLQLASLILAMENERHNDILTMLEYLPYEWRCNLDRLLDTYISLGKMMELVDNTENKEAVDLLIEFLDMTNFSNTTIHVLCIQKNLNEEKLFRLLDQV